MAGAVLVVWALAGGASPAGAQGVRLEIEAGYDHMTNARRSADAVFGSAGGAVLGLAAGFEIGDRLVLTAGVRHLERDGERVFVADPSGEVFRLGHPLTARLIPLRVSARYRLPLRGVFTPYAGIGGGLVSYRESSEVGGLVTTESLTKASWHVLAGVEVGRGRLRAGLEMAYSMVPGAVGVGGVSEVYGESDIGGLSVVAKLIVARGSRRDPSAPGSGDSRATTRAP
jgi:opacity protein-like surface antigen